MFCVVCQCTGKENERVIRLPCLHQFHRNCVVPYLERQEAASCPLCRTLCGSPTNLPVEFLSLPSQLIEPISIVESSNSSGPQRRGGRMDVAFLLSRPVENEDGDNNDGRTVTQNIEPRYNVHIVVAGDGKSICSSGVMVKRQMYATSDGGAGVQGYWKCDWDASVTAGMPYGTISLKARSVVGMDINVLESSIRIPPNRRQSRNGGLDIDVYVARFLRDWCQRHPGVGVCLARVGAGTQHRVAEFGRMSTGAVPFSKNFNLDCVTSAAINSVFQLCDENTALSFANSFHGPLMHQSLRSIGRLFHSAQIPCRIQKLPRTAIKSIEQSDHMEAFNWFANNTNGGVYIVHLRSPLGVHHAVVVDCVRLCIIDSEQPVILNLTADALYVCSGCGVGNPRVVSGRQVVYLDSILNS